MKLFHPSPELAHALHHAVGYALHHRFHPLHGFHCHPARHRHHGHRPVPHAGGGSALEHLEPRELMSAAPLTAAALFAKATVKVPTIVKPTATTTTATTTTTTGPTAVANPAATSSAYAYASFAADPLFGPAGPRADDVSQGELGDCYLLSVLSGVARTDPGLIRRDCVANANGTFTVTFAGKRAVTVDAALPTLPGRSVLQPAYAQLGAGNSLWVAVVEKAYADLVNPKADAYLTISGGWMGDAFTALGLRGGSTFSAGSAAALATVVQRDLKAGDLVTYGTTPAVTADSPLVAAHAYEIAAVTLGRTGAVTSLTLRNPWGNDLPTGGYVTVTPQQAFAAFAGLCVAHA